MPPGIGDPREGTAVPMLLETILNGLPQGLALPLSINEIQSVHHRISHWNHPPLHPGRGVHIVRENASMLRG